MVTASMDVTSDFPTPPLPLTTPITFLMLLISCGFSEKSFFFSSLSAQSSEQLLQLWLQFSLIILAPSYIVFNFFCPFAIFIKSPDSQTVYYHCSHCKSRNKNKCINIFHRHSSPLICTIK